MDDPFDPLVMRCYSDPICPWSWAYEPVLRRIEVQYRSKIRIRPVMGGLALDRTEPAGDGQVARIQASWRRVAQTTGQPIEWNRAADLRPSSSRPLCEAVVAACLQSYAIGGRYLRLMREAHFLGGVDPYAVDGRLVLARQTPGLDVARWTQDLESGGAAVMTNNHFSETRKPSTGAPVNEDAGEGSRYGYPTLVWRDPRTETNRFFTDEHSLEDLLEAVRASGFKPDPLPSPSDAFELYSTLTRPEFEAITGLGSADADRAVETLASKGNVHVTDVHGCKVYRTV